ncbi:cupin domain-containing protein [Mycobacterium hodleri]|uniref:cupin domain-containing protein n=1 Tax=Mycolicibacterium hodleri TaxID=49897 RepID=UPI000B17843D|nr:cupin domain-containing protein [Mycolicibacterium hodleri]MCV7134091.1 cupin domain-containing protein [Mycolicibacterium hodleri]
MGSDISIAAVGDATVLRRPGKESVQILWPENAPDAQMTITRVTMQPGAVSPPHVHQHSEQVWIVEKGSATMLFADGSTTAIGAGQVVRTPAGVSHGVENSSSAEFCYLSVTSPPEDFTRHYDQPVPPPSTITPACR